MTIGAALLRGVPPSGLGAYDWQGGGVPPGPWDYLAVSDSSAGEVAAARATGLPLWAFAGPSSWSSSTWRATLARQVAACESGAFVGLVANPEESWRNAPASEVEAFGAALRAASERVRIGVVTIPGQPSLARLVLAAGPGVWWSIELYANQAHPSTYANHFARWRALGIPASRLVPSVAGFVAPSDLAREFMSTRETYRAYLEAFPGVPGALVWTNASTLRSRPFMGEELARRFGMLRTAPYRLASALSSRAAVLVGAVIALGVLFALTVL